MKNKKTLPIYSNKVKFSRSVAGTKVRQIVSTSYSKWVQYNFIRCSIKQNKTNYEYLGELRHNKRLFM